MTELSIVQALLGLGSGSLVGFALGLVGGGGSILAVPLMVYVIGVPAPHVAIGTTAAAVAANAAANLVTHARTGSVKWRCAAVFSLAGVVGALGGSTFGKMIDGERLLSLFALLMLGVAGLMLRNRAVPGTEGVRLGRNNVVKLLAFGFLAGALSGFFGIGGGFLIVPGLMLATGMPILNAIATSLVAVAAFGLTTAINYAVSGLVDWVLAALFLVAGAMGGVLGSRLAGKLAAKRGVLNKLLAGAIAAVALFMLSHNLAAA